MADVITAAIYPLDFWLIFGFHFISYGPAQFVQPFFGQALIVPFWVPKTVLGKVRLFLYKYF